VATATGVAALDAYQCLMHRDRAVRRALSAAAARFVTPQHLCAQCSLPLLALTVRSLHHPSAERVQGLLGSSLWYRPGLCQCFGFG
jgi:hypothetical protein